MSLNEYPLNEIEINGTERIAGVYEIGFVDSISIAGTLHDPIVVTLIRENISVSADIDSTMSFIYSEKINVSSILDTQATMGISLYASLDVKTRSILTMSMSIIEDSLFVDDSLVIDFKTVMLFVEKLIAKSDVSTTHNAIMHLVESIIATTRIDPSYALSFAEALNVDASAVIDYISVISIIENIVIGDTSQMSMRAVAFYSEGIEISDAIDSRALVELLLREDIQVGVSVNTPEGIFSAWVVNVETKAPWQYDNFPFNSFAKDGSRYLGLSSSGLYELSGDTDDGDVINATIRTGREDFGTSKMKSIPIAYFGYTSNGELLFKTITTESGNKIERWYKLKERTANDTTEARVKMGRGVRAVYWQFEITNIEGSDFNFDSVKFIPAVLKRRI